jgi:hypothetical protein
MQMPDDPKVLILGTSYIYNQHRKDELFLWDRLVHKLNPYVDTLLIDSDSPFDPRNFTLPSRLNVQTLIHMEENIGHPTLGGDGWGRDLCFGIDYAIRKNYEWLVFIESDLIFCRPVMPIVKKLCRIGCLAAMPVTTTFQWLETGLMFLSVPYLNQIHFVDQYNWQSHVAPTYCELEIEKLLQDEVLTLPLRGLRNDDQIVTRENFNEVFPSGCDYLTHCLDFELYNMLLRRNGIEL